MTPTPAERYPGRPAHSPALAVALAAAFGCSRGPSAPLTPPTTSEDTSSSAPSPTPTVEPPELAPPSLHAAPPGGVFDGPVALELVTDDVEAAIWYTVDGTVPTPESGTPYTGPILLDATATVRAIAVNALGTTAIAPTFVQAEPGLDVSSNLPLVVAWSAQPAPGSIGEPYVPVALATFEPDASGRARLPASATLSVRAGLKIRGSSTAWNPKSPYRLETWSAVSDEDEDVALLGMPEEADWVLGAPLDFDRALMRDPLMFALSNRIGRYAPRTRFVELFVAADGEALGADDYVGVYVVTERIERDGDRVDVARLDPDDLGEPEVTGGYLFKEDRPGPGEAGFTAGTAGGALVFQQPFVHVDPDEAEVMEAQHAYLVRVLDELGLALTSSGAGRGYGELIDVDAWIDHHALNVFAKNPDGLRLSAYFHKDREGPIVAGPVWDFDRTLGCATDFRAADPTWWDATNETWDTTPVFTHGFWGGLFADPAFRDRYWARLRTLLATDLSVDSVNAVIDGMAAELEEAAERNFAVWSAYPPRGGFAGEVALLREWVARRHAWMTACLDLPDPRVCAGD